MKVNLDREEMVNINKLLADGCQCDLAAGSCSGSLTVEYVLAYRSQCSELSRAELDMASFRQLAALTNTSPLFVYNTVHGHSASSQQRPYMLYWHDGKRTCRKTFLFLHTISNKRLRNLQESGLAPR